MNLHSLAPDGSVTSVNSLFTTPYVRGSFILSVLSVIPRRHPYQQSENTDPTRRPDTCGADRD